MGYVLVLGGARSGKSDRAQSMAIESAVPVTFVATATAEDREMEARIGRHRAARPGSWSTVEEPIDLLGAVRAAPEGDFVVVDCLTLWVANLLDAGWSRDRIVDSAGSCASSLAIRNGVVVSNEVGLGIVPANEMARVFRDVLGEVNALFARCAESAVLMVAGRALELR